MNVIFKRLIILSCLSLLFGCASNTKHDWGDYSDELYTYYKDPTAEEQAELLQELTEIFARAEKKGAIPPPGLYAEYGTFLFQGGDLEGAVVYYQKEKNAWPESTQFMDSLINALNKRIEDKQGEKS